MQRFLILICLLFASPAWGAVAYDTVQTATDALATDSISLTFTATGTNRLLLCSAHHQDAGTHHVTGITHNSVPLTQSAMGEISQNVYAVDVWYLVAPSTGAQTVTATFEAAIGQKTLVCISFTGADQAVPLGTGSSFSATTDPSTATVTIPANGMGAAFNTNNDQANAGSFTVDGNSTKRADLADTGAGFASIVSTTATAGSNAQTISNPATEYSAMIVLPINAASSIRRPLAAIIMQ